MSVNDSTLTKTICTLLGSIPGWAWRTVGPYLPSEVGVYYGAIPDSPDMAVGVRVYEADDDNLRFTRARRVQVRFRGAPDNPAGADDLADTARDALDGLSRVGGMSGVSRLYMAPLGADTNGRQERTDNYLVILDNKEATA